jgi:hypothetical protein
MHLESALHLPPLPQGAMTLAKSAVSAIPMFVELHLLDYNSRQSPCPHRDTLKHENLGVRHSGRPALSVVKGGEESP